MNLKELKQKISESPNKELFTEQKVSINFSKTGINREFLGISAFYEYLENQINGFKSFGEDIPDEFKSSLKHFEGLKMKVLNFLNSYSDGTNSSNFISGWVNTVERFISNDQRIFEYDAPKTNFLLEIFRQKKNYYSGALDYLTEIISPGGIQKREYLNGLLLGYEYFLQGETEIKKRRDIE